MELRTAVRAAVVHHLGAAGLAAVERVVLAHDADRLRLAGLEIFAPSHRVPELPQELSAGRAGPRGGDVNLARLAAKNDARHRLPPLAGSLMRAEETESKHAQASG